MMNTASEARATPRELTFITAKRNVPLAGRSYGHWWIEMDDHESYGWWPSQLPLRFRDVLRGVPGVLNGIGVADDGTPTRDPHHGDVADYEFHPILIQPRTDKEVRAVIRRFARTFTGEWQWSTWPTMNCRLFQLALFEAVDLVDGTGNYRTRGTGCPAIAPIRRVAARRDGRRRWPRNLPTPGRPVTSPTPSRSSDGGDVDSASWGSTECLSSRGILGPRRPQASNIASNIFAGTSRYPTSPAGLTSGQESRSKHQAVRRHSEHS